jgi:hypothetical protein
MLESDVHQASSAQASPDQAQPVLRPNRIGLLQQLAQCLALSLSASSIGMQIAMLGAPVAHQVLFGGDSQAWVQTWLDSPEVASVLVSHGFAVEALSVSSTQLGLHRLAVVLPLAGGASKGRTLMWITRSVSAPLIDDLLPQLFAFAKSMASAVDALGQYQHTAGWPTVWRATC